MAAKQETLRVGTVPFLVARPLDLGLEEEPGVELVRAVPAQLVEGLREGELDVALVSSIELFRRPGYRYLDGLAVAGRSHVSSVQVFLRRSLDRVARLALDPGSRAARTLVRVLLAAKGYDPELIEVADGADPRTAEADAWLRIGDAALRETYAPDALPTWNPSADWRKRTGLPFVFATWIVAPGVEIEPWAPAFGAARRRGAEATRQLADEAAAAWRLDVAHARDYLEDECLYEPGADMRSSLLEFRDRAAVLDLGDGSLTPDAVYVPAAGA